MIEIRGLKKKAEQSLFENKTDQAAKKHVFPSIFVSSILAGAGLAFLVVLLGKLLDK
jgi:hypothetical protein